MKGTYTFPCNIAQTLNLIGDRWTLLVAHEILLGHTTFNEIKKSLEGISANLLSDRLKTLEVNGLITSSLYSEHPPRYQYTLTESGEALEDIFNSFIIWGQNHLPTRYKKIIHQECQDEVEITYYCPTCQRNVQELEIVKVTDE